MSIRGKRNWWQLSFVVALTVGIVLSGFIVLYVPSTAVSAQPNFLDVAISGPDKIPVNLPTTYTASVEGTYFGKLTYTWILDSPDENLTLTPLGDKCNLTFVNPTDKVYTLKVEVQDEGNSFGVGTKSVVDPASFPNLYLGTYGAPYSYMVCVDESGAYYYAINGKTGAVSFTSTDAATTLQNTFNLGKSVKITGGFDWLISSPLYFSGSDVDLDFDPKVRLVDATGGTTTTLTISGVNVNVYNLRMIKQVGNEGTGNLLELNACNHGNFYNVWLYNVNGVALTLTNNTYYNCFYNLFINVAKNGILLDSKGAIPSVNENHFYGSEIGIGASSDFITPEYAVKLNYANVNEFVGLDIENRGNFSPDGIVIYSSKGTTISNLYVGERNFTNAIEIDGDGTSATGTFRTTLVGCTVTLSAVGVYVNNATATSITSFRGTAISSYLVTLTANHKDTTLTSLNLHTGSNYLSDAQPTETVFLDPNQATQKMVVTGATLSSQTNKQLLYLASGMASQDIKIVSMGVTLLTAPSAGNNTLFELTDGTNSMTVNITNPANTGYTVANSFVWDVSSKSLILRYTSSSSAASSLVTIVIEYRQSWT